MKLGIVMEGGASRTVFSCGVTDCFLEEELSNLSSPRNSIIFNMAQEVFGLYI